jgi:N-acyl-D-amino-acid deacylase
MKWLFQRALVPLLVWLSVLGCRPGTPAVPATLIDNVVIYDGRGGGPTTGAVRIVGDTIAAVGRLEKSRGDSVIDGRGLALAPGFIDTHSHQDWGLTTIPDALGAVSQGITTIIAGQDGSHAMPLAGRFDTLAAHPAAINVASYAGHGTIRGAVLGKNFQRKATKAEVDSMAVLLRREMGAGALGLSSGLEYDPGIYSDRSELLTLAKVAADSGGRYISHIRSEDRWFWDAVDEIVTIGREAKIPVQVSHMKLAMTNLWGQADSLIRLLDRARAAGVEITADVYPYPYWQSTLTVLFPKRDFTNRTEAEKILKEIAPPDGLLLGRYQPNPEYVGKTVAQIAESRREDAATTLMTLIKMALDYGQKHPEEETVESVVATSMTEEDIAKLLAWEQTNFSSDGELDGPHPRGFGTYPRIFGRYVRERKVMPLEVAVKKATSLAAAHMGLNRRGLIQPGYFADLVLFDPNTVLDRATPADPHAVSVGIERVWVNGQSVYQDGKTTGRHPGKIIRRGDK